MKSLNWLLSIKESTKGHRSKENAAQALQEQQKRDVWKQFACHRQKVILIEVLAIGSRLSLTEAVDFIVDKLRKQGFSTPDDFSPEQVPWQKAYLP